MEEINWEDFYKIVEIFCLNAKKKDLNKGRMSRLYFIQHGNKGPIKIGFTRDPVGYRLQNLQPGTPIELKLLFYKETLPDVPRTQAHPLEKYLQRKFSDSRIRGEWFNPTMDLITHIIQEITKSWYYQNALLIMSTISTESTMST